MKSRCWFQFPSNGKAYPKSESTSPLGKDAKKFQFPSNGKADPKYDEAHRVITDTSTFQFPSNGKAYPKTYFCFRHTGIRQQVSIPFKRESVSKDVSARIAKEKKATAVSIPFKRESGSKVELAFYVVCDVWFQFPSNGKAYPKKRKYRIHCISNCRFNSLQTGKRIQSFIFSPREGRRNAPVSIPFKRESVSKARRHGHSSYAAMEVSIPFKRESVSKDVKIYKWDILI